MKNTEFDNNCTTDQPTSLNNREAQKDKHTKNKNDIDALHCSATKYVGVQLHSYVFDDTMTKQL